MYLSTATPGTSNKNSLLQRSLRAKVTLGVGIPLLLIVSMFTLVKYLRRSDTVFNNLSVLASNSGQVIEFNLRRAMLADDFDEVQTLLDAIGQTPEFSTVSVLDTSGEIIFAPHEDGVGTTVDNHQEDCQPCHRLPAEARPASIVVDNAAGERVFRSMRPIENSEECRECHKTDGRLLGLLLTDIPADPMEAAVNADLHENLLWSAATILLTIIIVNVGLSQVVLRRLERLARAIAGLGEGRLHLALPESQPDEIGQLSAAFNTMASQVETREAENRMLSKDLQHQIARRNDLLQRLINAQENERKRVAQELHDELGQALSGLALRVGILEHYIQQNPEQASTQLNDIRSLIEDTSDAMYDLILDLRPSTLDDLGLASALRDYADRVLKDSEIAFDLHAEGLEERLPPTIETSLYRVFQESMSNIVHHAEASSIQVRLRRYNGTFEGIIRDDGKGFDVSAVLMDGSSPRGLGLMGIQERVAQCGGTVRFVTEPGAGTQVHVEVPLGEEPDCDR
jgi:signal transduction histidine kinase